jgi:ATP-dependent helicase/DNAse subunit B
VPLTIIKGPPNSGRTDEVQDKYLSLLPMRPVLVVPGVDDIFGWERRLTDGRGALLGGQIVHFKDLYSEIFLLARSERLPVASELHRLHLVRRAIELEWPDVAGRLRDQPGMAAALLELIDDFRAENMDPLTVGSVASERGRHLGPLAAVYGRYLDLLAEEGVTDLPAEAKAAVELSDRHWAKRPVLIAGFDELTRQQLDLVRRLAFVAGVDVTVAVTFEPGNPALLLTAKLVNDLAGLGPEDQVREKTKGRDGGSPHEDLLVKVQERFLRSGVPRDLIGDEDRTISILRSAGARNEAEAIGAEVAKLIADETSPSEIAIAVETPAEAGIVLAETLERYGIPVSLESETRVLTTLTGGSIMNLLEAFRSNSVVDLIAFLRSPAGPRPEEIDRLEMACRIADVESAESAMKRLNTKVPSWEELVRSRKPPAEVVRDLAFEVSDAILAGDDAAVPSAATVVEARAAEAIARACEEIEGLSDPEHQADLIIESISSGTVKVWSVPAQGTVKIASPYSLRAKRVEHLFCAGLQEAPLADNDKAGPFLSNRDRAALGMSERRDPEVQQRYLFYSALTVPTRSLCLSCRISDDTGAVEHPSPLISAVEDLFARDERELPRITTGGKLGSDVVFAAGDAPIADELARSFAVSSGPVSIGERLPGLDSGLSERIEARILEARAAEERTRRFGDLTERVLPAVVGEAVFAATDLEAYASCPYRWFIEREIRPAPFEPDPDFLAMGTLVHNALEEIYELHRGEIPRPETIDEWLADVPRLVEEHAAADKVGLGSDSVGHAALRRRAVLLIGTQLRRESTWENPAHLPWELEVSIGTKNAEIEAVEMGGWSLKGKIDRIDASPDSGTGAPREAVVIDYKTGTVDGRSHHKAAKDRRVQVQLYLHALKKVWNLDPVAGIYVPVRLGGEKSRGAFESDERTAAEMAMRGVSSRDKVDSLAEFIESGLETAADAVRAIKAGRLDHDPALCPDHFEHPAVRSVGEADAEEEFLNRSFV